MAVGITIIAIGFFLVSGAIMIKSSSFLVRAISEIAIKLRMPEYIVTFFLLSLATTFPELSVGVLSAIRGNELFALSVPIGSSIASITVVAGILAVVSGIMGVRKILERKDAYYVVLFAVTLLLFLADGVLTRIEGCVLVLLYFLNLYNFKQRVENYQATVGKGSWRNIGKGMGFFVLGVVGLLLGAEIMVRSAEAISVSLNIPFVFIGLIFVSLCMVVPELLFELKAWKTNHKQMALGSLLGNVTTNLTLVVGIIAIVKPVQVSTPYGSSALSSAIVFLVIASVLFVLFLRASKTLTRAEGFVLIFVYVLYFAIAYMQTFLEVGI